MQNKVKIIFLGDIVGSPGRKAVKIFLPELTRKYKPTFIIANAENAAGGYGLTEKVAEELFSYGIDILTSGNHIWKREFFPYLQKTEKVLRPANYGEGAPGKGWNIYSKKDIKLGVINLEGRTFMKPLENPFKLGKTLAEEIKKETPFIVVDFHAEATSEKMGLAYFLDGFVSAVIGTHTHVQTSDERIMPKGSGYITDVGMCGAVESIIGMKINQALEMYLTMVPRKLEVEKSERVKLEGVYLELDEEGKTILIERLRLIE
ncbi:MAG: TIGR00282 family metallophosphoesterase [Thermodesulfobacterium geofontis]|uniref:TIGR00282 family metallophosphoesterase n=1 Tax=Thermodesulfobacterium geofontis TaxID=1295609 RepID=A0A2N7Q847_9BACT|nr:MAG: TIGR00282 family metallophosphoesterase [Thermodesulfobacterium geofontis]PMP94382.1 MAG: TIGR00282 family metallophosphoesterase [Thermodesulfobacterium geofontis]